MEIQIRPATVTDAVAIAHVQVEGWKTTYRGIVPDSFLDRMDLEPRAQAWAEMLQPAKSLTLVAEDDANWVIGFVSGGPLREHFWGFDAELYAIYLLKSSHGRGRGAALVRDLAAALKHDGFHAMAVWALEANPAIGFYKHMGARPISGKITVIDGARIPEVALGWSDLTGI